MPGQGDRGVTANESGYHVGDGRNVILAGGGIGGTDVFAVQMSRMPMCLTDPHRHDNPIVICNQGFEQLTGHGQDEIIGRNCRFLQGWGHRSRGGGRDRPRPPR